MQRAVSIVWDFSAVSHRRRVGRRGTEPVRASILSVYASKSSLPGDCHVAALLAMTVALRVFAWSVIRVRVSSFLLYGISRLMPLNDKSVRNLLSLPPSGARRGGVKHRKNSPQVTVFSQSGEAAMLRAVRWIAEALQRQDG